MNVEASELENHLVEYIRRVRSTRETITVCESNEPVAILGPVAPGVKRGPSNLIDRLLASPWPVKDFTPFSRTALYEHK